MISKIHETNNNNKCYADFSRSKDGKKSTDILDVISFAPFLMWNDNSDIKIFEKQTSSINNNHIYDTNNTCDNDNYAELMKSAYFSSENMDIIQNMIIKNVFYNSKETLRINKIKSESLTQIMNHIWTNFCRFLPYDLQKQIKDLSAKVSGCITAIPTLTARLKELLLNRDSQLEICYEVQLEAAKRSLITAKNTLQTGVKLGKILTSEIARDIDWASECIHNARMGCPPESKK